MDGEKTEYVRITTHKSQGYYKSFCPKWKHNANSSSALKWASLKTGLTVMMNIFFSLKSAFQVNIDISGLHGYVKYLQINSLFFFLWLARKVPQEIITFKIQKNMKIFVNGLTIDCPDHD
jgi:hypothetical protein